MDFLIFAITISLIILSVINFIAGILIQDLIKRISFLLTAIFHLLFVIVIQIL